MGLAAGLKRPTAGAGRTGKPNSTGKEPAVKLTPIGDKIVVKRLEAEAKTKGGIVLPDSAQEKPKRGKVVAVGEGKRLDSGEIDKPSVKKGDEVIFSSFAGTEITIDREEFLIMSQSDILAVIKK